MNESMPDVVPDQHDVELAELLLKPVITVL